MLKNFEDQMNLSQTSCVWGGRDGLGGQDGQVVVMIGWSGWSR